MTQASTHQPLSARDLARIAPYIEGRYAETDSKDTFATFDPATGKKLLDIPVGSVEDVNRAVRAARASFRKGDWSKAPPSARKATLHKWADLIKANAERLNAFDALEMGKPVSIRAFDPVGAASHARFYAEAIDKVSGDVLTSDIASTTIQKRMPRGVVAAVVPWNFPTYNVVMKVAPALAAGNSVVLKPSELASQSALLLIKLAHEAGVPPGVLNIVPGRGEIVGRALGEHMDVDMVTFTGSSEVGKLMLQYSGKSNMKVVTAECGGKSPQIVFDDGLDLDAVADRVAGLIVLNQGQICSVGSRLLVQEPIQEALVQKIVARLEKVSAGNPQMPDTTYGPLVSGAQLSKVLSYIESANSDGADLVFGGSRIMRETGGNFVEPTVFVNVAEDSRIAQEEIFGPVLSVLRFRDVEDAIRLANSTMYGLAAYAWTTQMSTGFKLAQEIPTAVTIINASMVASEGPGHAFSGEPHGMSGVGIEGGLPGLETYMRRQTVMINHG